MTSRKRKAAETKAEKPEKKAKVAESAPDKAPKQDLYAMAAPTQLSGTLACLAAWRAESSSRCVAKQTTRSARFSRTTASASSFRPKSSRLGVGSLLCLSPIHLAPSGRAVQLELSRGDGQGPVPAQSLRRCVWLCSPPLHCQGAHPGLLLSM